ncbi:MAG: diguanylate cyclase [Telluria sp.]
MIDLPLPAPGPASKLRRMVSYWAATASLYLLCAGLVFREISAGLIPERIGLTVIAVPILGLSVFYLLIRRAARRGLPNWHLAIIQAVFAIAYDLLLYFVLKDAHVSILIGLPVVMVFCAFALRPHQTVALAALAIVGLAGACAILVVYGGHPTESEMINFVLTSIGIVSVTVVTGDLSKLRYRLNGQKQLLEAALAKIEKVARTDELTDLANRRRMNELLDSEERRGEGRGHCASIALIDIDHFKQINDQLGHSQGDLVLQAFAEACKRALRANDTLARWGGEEFLLLMPETPLEGAEVIVNRILAQVNSAPLAFDDSSVRITFSAGVAERDADEKMGQTVMRADRAMYAAKAAGRNRVRRDAGA